MKKWAYMFLGVIIIGIAVLIWNGRDKGVEADLEMAETFRKRGAYDQEIFCLQNALESSIKTNGTVSVQTAEIYRKLGGRVKDKAAAKDYYDKAIKIYAIEDEKKIPELYYEKGFWLMDGGSAAQDVARESFDEVIRLYGENQYDNSDCLCMSLYYKAFLEEDQAERFSYLKRAEEHLPDTSGQSQWRVTTIIKRAIAAMLLTDSKFESALEYYECLIELSENSEEDTAWTILADADAGYGAALVFTDKASEGEDWIKKAIDIYTQKADNSVYFEPALAYMYLALAYANQEPPKKDEALQAGITAFSFYKDREILTGFDLEKLEMLTIYMAAVYENVCTEPEEPGFEHWFRTNIRINANTYYFDAK